ncbi:hypothetical protein Jiend_14540 [Micromonospora endophytica]|nr:hypothetical protein Jiend_14540 [Micromonospora endophytica]
MSPGASAVVRARRAEWARVSGVGLVMTLAFELVGCSDCGTRAGPTFDGFDGNKKAHVPDARGQRTLRRGECAQVSTRSDRYDMGSSLTHLMR